MFPRRLTYRWFATRGWAFGAGATFLLTALLIQPPFLYETFGWLASVTFGSAGFTMLWLGARPESHMLRVSAVMFTMLAAGGRAWALLLSGVGHWDTRVIASAVWLFVAYACWLLAMFTAKVPNRGRR